MQTDESAACGDFTTKQDNKYFNGCISSTCGAGTIQRRVYYNINQADSLYQADNSNPEPAGMYTDDRNREICCEIP